LSWTSCENGFQCAIAEVPRDYRNPTAGTISLNLKRHLARDPVSLDGAYDPQAYANNPYYYDYGQYLALERALERFLDWCRQDQRKCEFGGGQDPAAAYDALVRALEEHPARDVDGKVIANGATLAYLVMLELNDGRAVWPRLGTQLQ
jgi:hypothetical protein